MHVICFFSLNQITTITFVLYAERSGWWLFEEGIIMPKKRDKVGRYVIVQVTYTGNSKHHDSVAWKNWSCLLNPIDSDTIWSGDVTDESPVATRQKRRANNTKNTSGIVMYILYACLARVYRYVYLVCMSCMHVLHECVCVLLTCLVCIVLSAVSVSHEETEVWRRSY